MSEARRDAESIFRAALARVDSREMMKRVLSLDGDTLTVRTETENHALDLRGYKRVLVMAVGKAASGMALGLHDVLGERISKGLVVTKHDHDDELPLPFLSTTASHPVPDETSVQAGEKLRLFCESARSDDLLIGLISGGGSSLVTLPIEGLTLEDKRAVTSTLLASGASIHEINAVRKRLSRLKGGKLLRAIQPADSLNLILSDVVGDDLDVIASGLTVPHSSFADEARTAIEKYGLASRIPSHVRSVLETDEEGTSTTGWLRNVIVGSNAQALRAAALEAQRLGYRTQVLPRPLTGEARDAASLLLREAKAILGEGKACFLAGGETTVTLKGEGRGGRNQEMALAALVELRESARDLMFFAASTDGGDGPTDAAGAFVDRDVLSLTDELGLDPKDYLARNDSYSFFEKVGGLFKTGPTGTNVCDLQFVISGI